MAVKFKTKGPGCTCGGPPCLVFSDNFNRGDEDINGLDSTTNWSCVPNLSVGSHWAWRISGNRLLARNFYAAPPSPPFRAFCETTVPRHFSCSVKLNPLNGFSSTTLTGAAANITYQAETLDGDDLTGTRRYKVRLEFSSSKSSDISNHAGQGCGILNFWDVTDLLAPIQIGIDTRIPGLGWNEFEARWPTLKLCYDPETQVLSAYVTTYIGTTYAHHVFGVATAADPLEASNVWLEVENFGDVGQSGEGQTFFYFDDFKISQTKNTPNDYGSGYGGIGDDDVLHCPCCKPPGCEAVSDNRDGGALDCRWIQDRSSFSVSGGSILSSTANKRLIWSGSWSGLDDDCLPDHSTRIQETISSLGTGGVKFVFYIDYLDSSHTHRVVVTTESSAGAGDGTIEIYDVGTLLATATGSVPMNSDFQAIVCFDGYTITAQAADVYVESDVTPHDGMQWGIGTGGSTGSRSFGALTVTHNVYSQSCPGCFTGTIDDGSMGDTSGCDPCFETAPANLKLRIEGPVCGDSGGIDYGMNGTYLLPSASFACVSVLLDCGVVDVASLDKAVSWGTALPGLGGVFGANYIGTLTDATCIAENGGTGMGGEVSADVYVGMDGSGEAWAYLIVSQPIPETGPGFVAIYGASLGPCPVDPGVALEFLHLRYIQSCVPGCSTSPPDQFCRWSAFNMSIRR